MVKMPSTTVMATGALGSGGQRGTGLTSRQVRLLFARGSRNRKMFAVGHRYGRHG